MEKRKRYSPKFKPHREQEAEPEDAQVQEIIARVESELQNSIQPAIVPALNSFQRRLVHRHFDNSSLYVTKTYRHDENCELWIYPVGNLINFAKEKAEEAIRTGKRVVLPHMGSYERFVIHDALKVMETIKTQSFGEGEERHIEIEPVLFGRGLKKIIKKIRLF